MRCLTHENTCAENGASKPPAQRAPLNRRPQMPMKTVMTCYLQRFPGAVSRSISVFASRRTALLTILLTLIFSPIATALASDAPPPQPVRGAANLSKAIHPAPAKAESVLTSVMTDFYDVLLVLATVFLLVMLGWSVSLRRRVREQTLQIRDQVKREAAHLGEDGYRAAKSAFIESVLARG